MVSKKNALGKGLGALLENAKTDITSKPSNETNAQAGLISRINIDSITPNPFQPRIDFEKESLLELTDSIKEHGVIQPITVRKIGRDNFQIISGERRYQACKIAKIIEIPCYIRIANDQEMLEMAIVENIQRKNLNAIEIGLSYQRLIDECNLTHEQLSIKLSKNRSTISNFLRLLKLPVEVQKALRDSKITMGHARALLSFNSEAEILSAFKKIISESLSVRDAEKMNHKKKLPNEEKVILSRYELRMQNNISFQLKSDVKIKKNTNGKGQLVITFKNQDQLNEILDNFDQ
ncbi:MAG: ParB/RepB/Spo0J family partition protein [Flavobacteriales bacterium]|jgi:ParB family chromosome partitioning protein|nr:ParB/RepB/Spo0J family partition protein [Flavobacteriales bacterium]MBL6868821.1 ParB/RepB/Spo0J family partition protein [Flavobacteriales bacterium]|tara:strand:- start:971 stop:1846 length:876 start_codon:yes stop_codon:yes gene_type:complete